VVRRAQELLAADLDRKISLESGFNDQSYFTNKFRQFVGATPDQYLSGLGT
jgi:AraC-like DNA-binding protein